MKTGVVENRFTTAVALNESEQRGERVHCTILFRFGFMNGHAALLSTSKEVLINQAAPLLFAEYVSDILIQQAINGKCFAQANITTLHFSALHSSVLPKITSFFDALFVEELDVDTFAKLKERARENFSRRYADTEYRAYLKVLEVCGYEAQFRLEDLVRSLKEITFEEYTSFLSKMLHLGNIVMLFDGKTETLSQDAILKQLPVPLIEEAGKGWAVTSTPSTAAMLSGDYSLELLGSKEMYVFALRFYFGEVAPNDMFIFLLFVAAALDVPATIMLDGYMPSIICFMEEEREIDASLLRNLSEEHFESLKLNAEILLSSVLNDPQGFGEIVVQALSQGVSIFDIFAGFASVSFEDVLGFIEDEYPQIRKGLVHMRAEGTSNE